MFWVANRPPRMSKYVLGGQFATQNRFDIFWEADSFRMTFWEGIPLPECQICHAIRVIVRCGWSVHPIVFESPPLYSNRRCCVLACPPARLAPSLCHLARPSHRCLTRLRGRRLARRPCQICQSVSGRRGNSSATGRPSRPSLWPYFLCLPES